MAQTGKMQTYQDAINALINELVVLPPNSTLKHRISLKKTDRWASPLRKNSFATLYDSD
jgi:hypothetical protein